VLPARSQDLLVAILLQGVGDDQITLLRLGDQPGEAGQRQRPLLGVWQIAGGVVIVAVDEACSGQQAGQRCADRGFTAVDRAVEMDDGGVGR